MAFGYPSHSSHDKNKIVRPLREHLIAPGVNRLEDEWDIEWGGVGAIN
jgi:hypothetical protein